MRKLLVIILLLLPGVQSYAQRVNFTQKVFSCNFSEMDKPYWPIINNSGFNFVIEDGHYTLECLDPAKKAYAPLRWDKRPEVYMLETNLRMEQGSEGSLGLVFAAQAKLQTGYILQIDKDKRYRICIIEFNNFRPLTGDRANGGWLEFKKLNKAGINNKLVLIQDDGKISILFNDVPLITYHNKLKSLSGEFGFLLTGRSKAVIQDFNIYESGPPSVDSITIKASLAQKQQAERDSIVNSHKPSIDSNTVMVSSGNPAAVSKTTVIESKKSDKKKSSEKKAKKPQEKIIEKKAETASFKPDDKPIIKDTTVVIAAAAPVKEIKTSEPAKKSKKEDKKDKKTSSKPENKKSSDTKLTEGNKIDLQSAPKDSTPKDITTLSIALGDSRKESQKLKKDNENLSAELKQVKMKNEELQSYINKYLDVKLKTDLEQEKNKNEIIVKENEKLKEENSDLKGLKENIARAKDGDIIIVLSDNLKKEQKKNDELTRKIKELEDKPKSKAAPVKQFAPPVKKPDAKTSEDIKPDAKAKPNSTTPSAKPEGK